MDESNDKVNRYLSFCPSFLFSVKADVLIFLLSILVWHKIFSRLKNSLISKGLYFSKSIAFMSDTTNVMKDQGYKN